MEEQLKVIFTELYGLWADVLKERGGLDDAVSEITKALTALRNAQRVLEYNLPLTKCAYASEEDGALIHATDGGYVTRCGHQFSLHHRIVPEFTVPTCTTCQNILRSTTEQAS